VAAVGQVPRRRSAAARREARRSAIASTPTSPWRRQGQGPREGANGRPASPPPAPRGHGWPPYFPRQSCRCQASGAVSPLAGRRPPGPLPERDGIRDGPTRPAVLRQAVSGRPIRYRQPDVSRYSRSRIRRSSNSGAALISALEALTYTRRPSRVDALDHVAREQDVLAQDPPADVQDDVVLAVLEPDGRDGSDLPACQHSEAASPSSHRDPTAPGWRERRTCHSWGPAPRPLDCGATAGRGPGTD
jgi:hypothetical protein